MIYDRMFLVENDAAGRFFIEMLRQTLCRDTYKLRIRGRHRNRKKMAKKKGISLNYTNDVPLKYADRFAVYISRKKYER